MVPTPYQVGHEFTNDFICSIQQSLCIWHAYLAFRQNQNDYDNMVKKWGGLPNGVQHQLWWWGQTERDSSASTEDFHLTSYSKMRVNLAVQILSHTLNFWSNMAFKVLLPHSPYNATRIDSLICLMYRPPYQCTPLPFLEVEVKLSSVATSSSTTASNPPVVSPKVGSGPVPPTLTSSLLPSASWQRLASAWKPFQAN